MKPQSVAEQMTEAVAASSNNTTMLVLFRQRFEGPSLMRGEQAATALLSAFELLTKRGNGSAAWASPFRDNALAFLLDSMSDATNLWGSDGELLYRNRAAEQLGIGRCDDTAVEELTIYGRHFERRTARCRCGGKEYLFEILRDLERPRFPTERALIDTRESVRSEPLNEDFRA
jgi:hypothetical protein